MLTLLKAGVVAARHQFPAHAASIPAITTTPTAEGAFLEITMAAELPL